MKLKTSNIIVKVSLEIETGAMNETSVRRSWYSISKKKDALVILITCFWKQSDAKME